MIWYVCSSNIHVYTYRNIDLGEIITHFVLWYVDFIDSNIYYILSIYEYDINIEM
jgi:hypothetical protein